MSSSPLVSVLIPCFNAQQWITATLDSVYAQTWPRLEVIVVDDGSTDDSLRILETYVPRGLKLISQVNRGKTAALNRALEVASGSHVQYLDADDLLAPCKIQSQLVRLVESPRSIAAGPWTRFWHSPEAAIFQELPTYRDLAPVEWLVADWAQGGGMMFPAMWLLPRGIVDEIGPWREDLWLMDDTEYFARAVLASERVLYCAEARTLYRSRIPGSISTRKSPRAWRSYHSVLCASQSYLLGREDSERTRYVCSMLWQRFAYGCYPYDRALADDALARAAALHSAKLPLEGGKLFHLISATLGWKRARLLQRLAGRA